MFVFCLHSNQVWPRPLWDSPRPTDPPTNQSRSWAPSWSRSKVSKLLLNWNSWCYLLWTAGGAAAFMLQRKEQELQALESKTSSSFLFLLKWCSLMSDFVLKIKVWNIKSLKTSCSILMFPSDVKLMNHHFLNLLHKIQQPQIYSPMTPELWNRFRILEYCSISWRSRILEHFQKICKCHQNSGILWLMQKSRMSISFSNDARISEPF